MAARNNRENTAKRFFEETFSVRCTMAQIVPHVAQRGFSRKVNTPKSHPSRPKPKA